VNSFSLHTTRLETTRARRCCGDAAAMHTRR